MSALTPTPPPVGSADAPSFASEPALFNPSSGQSVKLGDARNAFSELRLVRAQSGAQLVQLYGVTHAGRVMPLAILDALEIDDLTDTAIDIAGEMVE